MTSAVYSGYKATNQTNKLDMFIKKKCTYELQTKKTHLYLAHLSRRVIGELIGYSWSGIRPSSSVRRRRSQCSKIFFLKTARPIKFYVEPPWVGGTKVCSWHLVHMTKMAAMPIYGKNPSKIFFSRTCGLIFIKLGM